MKFIITPRGSNSPIGLVAMFESTLGCFMALSFVLIMRRNRWRHSSRWNQSRYLAKYNFNLCKLTCFIFFFQKNQYEGKQVGRDKRIPAVRNTVSWTDASSRFERSACSLLVNGFVQERRGGGVDWATVICCYGSLFVLAGHQMGAPFAVRPKAIIVIIMHQAAGVHGRANLFVFYPMIRRWNACFHRLVGRWIIFFLLLLLKNRFNSISFSDFPPFDSLNIRNFHRKWFFRRLVCQWIF